MVVACLFFGASHPVRFFLSNQRLGLPLRGEELERLVQDGDGWDAPTGKDVPGRKLGSMVRINGLLVGGFKDFYFHPYLGKIPILTNIFQMG